MELKGKGPGRQKNRRNVAYMPEVLAFKPRGVPMMDLEVILLAHEELEAMRLVDLEGVEQQAAAEKMDISRTSLSVDLKNARRKVTQALVEGKAINIQGGSYVFMKDIEDKEE